MFYIIRQLQLELMWVRWSQENEQRKERGESKREFTSSAHTGQQEGGVRRLDIRGGRGQETGDYTGISEMKGRHVGSPIRRLLVILEQFQWSRE